MGEGAQGRRKRRGRIYPGVEGVSQQGKKTPRISDSTRSQTCEKTLLRYLQLGLGGTYCWPG